MRDRDRERQIRKERRTEKIGTKQSLYDNKNGKRLLSPLSTSSLLHMNNSFNMVLHNIPQRKIMWRKD